MDTHEPVLALGLMSGTSLDGIDAALLWTDGAGIAEPRGSLSIPYDDKLHAGLRAAVARAEFLPGVDALERAMTLAHATVVGALLRQEDLLPESVRVIGFHGQTLLHRPDAGVTWQIGDGALLAVASEIDVVSDFRAADIDAGGEGAPLAPVFHAVLAGELAKPVAVLNIGGVANVSWIGAQGRLLAFDTGPGNAMIDDWCLAHTGCPLDTDGALAAAGKVDDTALAALLDNPYFARKSPKSLDRNAFDAGFVAGLSPRDGAATLTAF
ncbi:MAG: Anhydro-N-acetylmuramic acid kinase, partial [Alphaproteobacteria bacterium MarineAlpha10_Bin3]